MNTQLHELIAVLAQMPRDHLLGLADRISRLPDLGGDQILAQAILGVPSEWEGRARSLTSAMRGQLREWTPRSLSEALRAASLAHEQTREASRAELAWTGPSSLKSTFRRTDRAWVETIEEAQESLWIASFSVGNIDAMEEAVINALRRNVVVKFLFETSQDSGGYLRNEGYECFSSEVKTAAHFYRWPIERRERDDRGTVGIMHAKCVVADHSVLFISSANLSGAALERNLEVGIILRGGPIPPWLASRFDELVSSGVIQTFRPS